jgi:hypothetical protein
MDYALFPFPTFLRDARREFPRMSNDESRAGRPDIRDVLARRGQCAAHNVIGNLDLLNYIVDCLRELPWQFWIDHCHEEEGQLHLAVMADDLGHDLDRGDRVNAGFYLQNSEKADFETLACSRVFRVACVNGAILECEKGQSFAISTKKAPPADWRARLREVIARSFSGNGLDVDIARFRATTQQMIVSPYEFLCNLSAQGLITDDEQSDIQSAFNEAADFSMYGLINAVTQIAHGLRADDRWARAFYVERLGGQILRGDHNLPVQDTVPAY